MEGWSFFLLGTRHNILQSTGPRFITSAPRARCTVAQVCCNTNGSPLQCPLWDHGPHSRQLSQTRWLRPPMNKSPSLMGHLQRLKCLKRGGLGDQRPDSGQRELIYSCPFPVLIVWRLFYTVPQSPAAAAVLLLLLQLPSHGQQGGAGRVAESLQWHLPRGSINTMTMLCHEEGLVSILWFMATWEQQKNAISPVVAQTPPNHLSAGQKGRRKN